MRVVEQTRTSSGAARALRSHASVLFMMGGFTFGWANCMFWNWTNLATQIAFAIFLLLTFGFFGFGGATMGRVRRWLKQHPDEQPSPDAAAAAKGMNKGAAVLFSTEVALIIIAIVICLALGHWEYIVPSIVLIMGAHFIPFARLWHRRFDYVPAIFAIAVALGGILALALGHADPQTVMGAMGAGGALSTTAYGVNSFVAIRARMARSEL